MKEVWTIEQLSFSGTVKGMFTFTLAQALLQKGSYFVVEEMENYFIKEIVTTPMRFFMNNRLNKSGGLPRRRQRIKITGSSYTGSLE